MSAQAVYWAKNLNVANKAARTLLLYLAEMAEEDGSLCVPLRALNVGLEGLDSEPRVNRALNLLLLSGHVAKQWNPDKYVWEVRLCGVR